MKPRIWYNWNQMCWMPVLRSDVTFESAWRATGIAEAINRRMRLQHVGAHQ
jgi:hypothetical protein